MKNEKAVNPSAVGQAGFDVRLVPPQDIAATVLPLWRKGMSDARIVQQVQQRFEWLYQRNPAGRTCTWVVFDRGSQEVLGACSIVPHPLHVGGSVLRAGLLVDFIVDPKARVAGPAVALQRGLAEQSVQEGFDLLFGYPNRKAWPIFARAGFKALAGTRMWARSLRADPTRIRRLLARTIATRLPRLAGPAAALAAWPAAVLVQAASRVLEAVYLARRPRLRASVRAIGSQAPELARPMTSLLSTDVSAEHLLWRFGDHPTQDYRLIEIHEGGTCVAWAIVRLYEESAEVQAAQWLQDDMRLPRALWWHLARQVRLMGREVLSVNLAGAPEVDQTLAGCLFLERPDDRKVILRPLNEWTTLLLAKLPALAACSGWHLFAGTLDI